LKQIAQCGLPVYRIAALGGGFEPVVIIDAIIIKQSLSAVETIIEDKAQVEKKLNVAPP
jgi:hypothetical protein